MPFANLKRIKLHYLDHGSGEPILFLHGFTIDHRQWIPLGDKTLIDWCKLNNFRAIIPDMRGHGMSDAPKTDYRRADRVLDLIELLDELKIEKCHVVGLSMGGSTGIGMAFSHPERMRSLTLVATGAAGYNVGTKISKLDNLAIEVGIEPAKKQWAEWSMSYYDKKGRADISSLLSIMIQDHSGAIWLDPMRGKYQRTNDLEHVYTIKLPTLIMIGSDDKIFVPLARQLHERIGGSKLIVYDSVGHMINLEIPQRFYSDLADFLRNHRGDTV